LREQLVGIIQFEYNSPWAQAGSTLAATRTFLEDYGYKLFLLRTTRLHPFNYARYGEFYSYSNFIAVSPEKLPIVNSLIGAMI